MPNLFREFSKYDASIQKQNNRYSGLLGLRIGGEERIDVPNRAGFVYVRLRNNLSEVVQAFNDKVSPVYDFPVIIERKGNRWVVIGTDSGRYETFGTISAFIPAHASQHEFNRDGAGGGDIVGIYADQFMPLLVYPSGTAGAGNLQVAPYLLQRGSDFIYVGNTGTANLLGYKPTGSSAIMGLVYLNRDTGNPGILISSGTPFAGTITGTAGVSPYIPYPASNQEPLYAFRLVSGTQSLTWDNLYNARQFVGGGGSSTSTGSSLGTYDGNRVLITNASGTVTTDSELYYDKDNNLLILGNPNILPVAAGQDTFWNIKDGASPANLLVSYGSGFAPFITGFMADGSYASPANVKNSYPLFRLRARGYDGTTWSNTQGEIRYVGAGNWAAGSHPLKQEFYVTPTGSTTLTLAQTIDSDGTLRIVGGAKIDIADVGNFYTGSTVEHALQEIGIRTGSSRVVQRLTTESGMYTGIASAVQIPFDNTIPQISEGSLLLSRTITPNNASNELLIEAIVYLAHSAGSNYTAAVFQGTGTSAVAAGAKQDATSDVFGTIVIKKKITAGVTTELLFTLRAGTSSVGTLYLNGRNGAGLMGGVLTSSLTITELTP